MPRRIAAKITGVSGYVPPRVMSNAELEKLVDTNDDWIRERTGIRERHVAEKGRGRVGSGHGRRPAGPGFQECAGVGNRPDRGCQRDSGHDVSRDGLFGSKQSGRDARLGIRSFRGLLRICLCPDGRRAICRRRNSEKGPGHRQRRHDFDPGLSGPGHVRALWRWRGRGPAGTHRPGRRRHSRLRA